MGKFLVAIYPLSNIEITWYFNYESKFNRVNKKKEPMSKISMTRKIKKRTGFQYILTEIEHIPQDVLNKIKDKSITHNIFIVQSDNSTVYEFYCVAFTEHIIAGKTLLDYNNYFLLVIYKCFKDKYDKRKRKA